MDQRHVALAVIHKGLQMPRCRYAWRTPSAADTPHRSVERTVGGQASSVVRLRYDRSEHSSADRARPQLASGQCNWPELGLASGSGDAAMDYKPDYLALWTHYERSRRQEPDG